MIMSPYKNNLWILEKGVYVCVYLLYGTSVLRLFFSFFSFVTRNMAGYIVSISSFVFGAPPRASSFTEHYTKQWAVSNFLSLFALNIFGRGQGGGGGFLLLLSSTLVTFCTWKPQRGFLTF